MMVRYILKSFTRHKGRTAVLIGDEITGNLDSVTGFEVMEIVVQTSSKVSPATKGAPPS